MYKVYHMNPGACYGGFALIAAMSAEEANEYIADYKEQDASNACNSYGWTYVYEDDAIEDLTSSIGGIVYNYVYYSG